MTSSTSTSSRAHAQTTVRRSPLGEAVGPILLALLASVGQIKTTALLSWSPVDPTILLSVAVACWTVLVALVRPPRLGPATPLLLLLLLLGVATIGAPLSDYARTKELTLFFVTTLLMLSPVALLASRQSLRVFFSTLLGVAVFAAALTIVNPVAVTDYSSRITFDGTSTIGAARLFGTGIVVCVVRAVWSDARMRERLAYGASTMLLVWALLSTGSRGPFVALLAALLVVCVVAVVTHRSSSWMIALVVGIMTLGAVVVDRASAEGTSRILGFFQGARDASTRARTELWRGTVDAIPDTPLGVGIGDFSSLSVLTGAYTYPHNLVLEVFVEAGWIAGVLLCAILVLAFARSLRYSRVIGDFLPLAMLSFATVNAMVSGDMNSNRLLWVLVAVSLMTPMMRDSYGDRSAPPHVRGPTS